MAQNPNGMSQLDSPHVIKRVFDSDNDALRISQITGSLVTEPFDFIALTYVPSGAGAGEIFTVTYKSGGSSGITVSVLTLTYNASNKLETVTKS